ncbi:MAG: ABC transporter ATP-binding protein, partial [Acidimicrobiales bacterium]
STFLRSVNRINERLGYVRITGAIDVMGENIYAPGVELIQVRKQIGMVFQGAELFPSLTAFEQLELAAHIQGGLNRDARDRAHGLLDEIGLADRQDHRPGQLSGGERQRVGIARALMNRPLVLLADEPTSSLDPERAREIMELLAAVTAERGLATVVVSHDPAHLDLTHRELVLESGRLRNLEAASG